MRSSRAEGAGAGGGQLPLIVSTCVAEVESYWLRLVCCFLFVLGLWHDLAGSWDMLDLLWLHGCMADVDGGKSGKSCQTVNLLKFYSIFWAKAPSLVKVSSTALRDVHLEFPSHLRRNDIFFPLLRNPGLVQGFLHQRPDKCGLTVSVLQTGFPCTWCPIHRCVSVD